MTVREIINNVVNECVHIMMQKHTKKDIDYAITTAIKDLEGLVPKYMDKGIRNSEYEDGFAGGCNRTIDEFHKIFKA